MKVLETRCEPESVYRRHYCAACDERFITQEVITDLPHIPYGGVLRPRGRPKKTINAHNPFGL
jgi:hypothetical protein